MKILFVVSVLKGIGGIESSLLNLINNIKELDHEIHLCVLGNYVSETTKIPDNVTIRKGNKIIEYCCVEYKQVKDKLNLKDKVILILIKLIKKVIGYRRILLGILRFIKNDDGFDIAISYSNDMFLDVYSGGCEDYVLNCVKAKRKIAWIHNDARMHGLTNTICKDKYKKFDAIVNVSNECKNIFDNIIPEYEQKSKVVTNMINIEELDKKKSLKSPFNNSFNIVTVARIENTQKRIDRIIDSCVLLKKNGITDFRWTIVGDGPDLSSLIEKAKQRKVLDIIKFLGRKSNPIPYIQFADLFVQTSDYEAYSMVLIEALSVGTPCLVTNYEAATDIITNNYNGWIVKKDASEIADKIEYLMKNRKNIIELKQNCIESCEKLNSNSIHLFKTILSNE